MAESVADLVLKDNYEQSETLSLAEAQAESMLEVHQRFIRNLEHSARLDRKLEALPDDDELARSARAMTEGLDAPRARGAAGLLEGGPLRRPARLRRTRGSASRRGARALLPAAAPRAVRRGHARAPAGPRDRGHPGGQQHAARRRHHVRVPAPRGDRAPRRPRSRARTRSRARSSACGPSGLPSRPSTTRSRAQAQLEMLLEGRGLIERGSRWLLRHRAAPMDIRSTVGALHPRVGAPVPTR